MCLGTTAVCLGTTAVCLGTTAACLGTTAVCLGTTAVCLGTTAVCLGTTAVCLPTAPPAPGRHTPCWAHRQCFGDVKRILSDQNFKPKKKSLRSKCLIEKKKLYEPIKKV